MLSFVRMRSWSVIVSMLLFSFMVPAQELVVEGVIMGEFDYLSTDHIGRVYLAKGHELFMYSSKGDLRYQFSDLSRGVIAQLDSRNPMKLLLFYPDYGEITFLDNTLSRTRDNVKLSTINLELARLACTSFDNGFWVYDPVSFRLVRFDQGLNMTNESSNINQLVGAEIEPSQMVEQDNLLYMHDPKHGVFVFDSFGTYLKLIPIQGAVRIRARPNGLFFQVGNKLIKYDLFNFEQTEIELPVSDFKSVSIETDRLFVLQKDRVVIYALSK